MGAELFHADGETDRQIDINKLLVAFRDFANAPNETNYINPLKTKRRPLYLKTQFVPRSKHFSSRL